MSYLFPKSLWSATNIKLECVQISVAHIAGVGQEIYIIFPFY